MTDDAKPESAKSAPLDQNKPGKVTVFGAGVAGLTAAHELVERGFEVTVIDPDIREEVSNLTFDRGIGGMARSQWAYWMSDGPLAGEETDDAIYIPRLENAADALLDDVILFTGDKPNKPVNERLADEILNRLARLVLRLPATPKDQLSTLLIMIGSRPDDPETDSRVIYVKDALKVNLAKLDPKFDMANVTAIRVGALQPEDLQIPDMVPPDVDNWLSFKIYNRKLLPGEHGFRFFPSFYRHLFETMQRTPILNPKPHERTLSNVIDNLVPSEGLGFARKGSKISFVIPRTPIKSLEVMQQYLQKILKELGYTLEDMSLFATRLLKYMTSSTERRAGEYESQSWGDFVEQDKYSKISRKHIEFGPQMSAALRGSESDARTQGNITIQLLMNQLREGQHPDCLLNAPTSTAWFAHWHDYLVRQKVIFRRGSLVGFVGEQAKEPFGPKVIPQVAFGGGENAPVEKWESGAYVLALSLPAAASLAQKFIDAAGAADQQQRLGKHNDFNQLLAFVGPPVDPKTNDYKPVEASPAGRPLQHLSGIQFYFDVDLQFWRGHTQYLDSKWGLTSIAQPQFWGRPRDTMDPYRSVLSVDIGIWDREYKGKIAWECTPDEIAARCWRQIVVHHNNAFKQRYGERAQLPCPIAYALDANLTFGDGELLSGDKSPFLVNRVNQYPIRPGQLANFDQGHAPPPDVKERSWYSVYYNWVLAGTYMKTYTRLTSMEGANESARHAVNALLTVREAHCDHCTIWDPEDNEVDDLDWLKDLDKKRFAEGKPHLLDALSTDD